MTGTVIAVLGAESTGKTTLVQALGAILRSQGHDVAVVPEALREFCERLGRTPTVHEQAGIAAEQTQRVAETADRHALVLADTTALMIAVYSDYIFDDRSVYAQAVQASAGVAMTLLMALDLPWVADGLQRDGAHVQEPVDTLIRQALARMEAPYAVVQGQGADRVEQALAMVQHVLDQPHRLAQAGSGRPRWRWICADCDDGDCEQHRLPR